MSRMTPASDDLDLLLAAWFEGDAHVREPETLYGGVIGRTSRTGPLPAWRLPERWIPVQLATRMQPRPRLVPILIAILLIAAVVAGAVFIGTRTTTTKLPPPFGLAANGQIMYISGDQLFRANADGSNPVQLASPDAFATSPIYSRDGARVAWRRFNGDAVNPTSVDMMIANADGSNQVVLDAGATAMTNPSWSSDGQWLSFVRYVGDPFADPDASHLIVAAVDGSRSTDLGSLGTGVWGPSFSPDGSMIAVSTLEGSLYVVGRDGSDPRELTHETYPSVGFKALSAIWSPDGKTLLFGAGIQDVVEYKIYVVGLDGQPERPFSPSRDNQDDAAYSPDGKYVAFLQQAFEGRAPVVVIADAAGKVVRLLPGLYGWHMPEWSPDGTKVAILDTTPDAADAPPNTSAIVIIDAFGTAKATVIYIPHRDDGEHPDHSLTWQRLAP